MNYIDILILAVIALFMYIGYRRGFIRDFLDLVALAGAILLAYFTYKHVGLLFSGVFAMPANLANTVAFFAVWFAIMFVYYALMTFFYERVPKSARGSRYNKWFGLLPAFVRAVIFVWFTINLLYILLASGPVRQTLGESYLSRNFTKSNKTVSDFLNKTFGAAVADTVDFLTVKPQSRESIALGFTTTAVTSDQAVGQEMLRLVNAARVENGEKELVFDEKLTAVGEAHCRDMFARGYFSHYTPDGESPFERMDAAKINYLIAGENLALAPTVAKAFEGLMASPGHKANILSTDFGKVGIGVIDGGVHGMMFAQEFTN